MSRLSPLSLPWTALALAGRFALPLLLWFTVGQVVRYVLFIAGFHLGLHHAVVPVAVISLLVMTTLAVTVAMLHSVRDGLPGVKARELDESVTNWTMRDEETILDALTRALVPFMIFYLAWGWYTDDAKAFEQDAAGRGNAQGGIFGQIDAMKSITALDDHVRIAIGLTAGFFVLKFIAERLVEPKLERAGALFVAFCEVNWTLFGLFSVNLAYGAVTGWIDDRVVWSWIADASGGAFNWLPEYWPLFKNAALGALVWLVIAGVILGVDADEHTALGNGRFGRGVASMSGMDRPRTPREVATRELRDKWVPAVYGVRLVLRAGMLPFGVFCALFAGLEVAVKLLQRGIFDLIGPHEAGWWIQWLHVIGFGVDAVHQVLRICLLAAAFDLVVRRARRRAEAERGATANRPQPVGVA